MAPKGVAGQPTTAYPIPTAAAMLLNRPAIAPSQAPVSAAMTQTTERKVAASPTEIPFSPAIEASVPHLMAATGVVRALIFNQKLGRKPQ
eukprot:scaffold131_cov335-Pavlova_lutheri.AAC.7